MGGDGPQLEGDQSRALFQREAKVGAPSDQLPIAAAPTLQPGNEATAHSLQHPEPTGRVATSPALLRLQALAGNRAVAQHVQRLSAPAPVRIQRQETSNPENMEEQLEQTGQLQRSAEGQPVQRAASSATLGHTGATSSSSAPSGGFVVQRRGGPKVGTLCVVSNVVSAGLTAGHAWLSYTPDGGTETTYGTWGNLTPKGLYRDREVGRPFAARRCTDVDAADVAALNTFAAGNNSWTLTNNCSSFAARGWYAVTGEGIDHTSLGIPNPSALGAGITAANGGATGVLPVGGPGASSGSSAGGGSGGSSGGGSSGGSSSL